MKPLVNPCSLGKHGNTMPDLTTEALNMLKTRGNDYGDYRVSFAAIATVWTVLLGSKLSAGSSVSPSDVGLLMAALKLVREAHKHKDDNLVDAVGYLIIVSMLEKNKEK